MKHLKRILLILLIAAIVFVCGYFFSSWSLVNSNEVALNNFISNIYMSLDEKNFVYFQNVDYVIFHDKNGLSTIFNKIVYEENVFTLSNVDFPEQSIFYCFVIDKSTIWNSNNNLYLYLAEQNNEVV